MINQTQNSNYQTNQGCAGNIVGRPAPPPPWPAQPPPSTVPDNDNLLHQATELLNFLRQLAQALENIQQNLFFGNGSAEGGDFETEKVLSINDLVNIATTRAACLTGFARTINARLVGPEESHKQLGL
jgi:hypothetical protein